MPKGEQLLRRRDARLCIFINNSSALSNILSAGDSCDWQGRRVQRDQLVLIDGRRMSLLLQH